MVQGDLPSTEPENGQGLRYCAGGEDNIGSGQHAEEEVHGFVEAALGEDNEDEQAVPKQGDDIGNEEGDGIHPYWSFRPGRPSKWQTMWLTLVWLKVVMPGAYVLGPHFQFTDTVRISDCTQILWLL